MSSIIEKTASVEVKNNIGNKRFAFFTSEDHGDVFVHEKDLMASGFRADDMVVGHSAVIDIKFEGGKKRTAKIHEINCRSGRENLPKHESVKKNLVRKLPYYAGVSSVGRVKVLKKGFGFITKAGHEDIFFPLSGISSNLVSHLKEEVEVKFSVEECNRGVLAQILDIVWDDSQLVRHQVDVNRDEGMHVFRVTNPAGISKLEIRRDSHEGELLAEPVTLTEARRLIGKSTVSIAPAKKKKQNVA
jgi:cold shock CspA family protein